MNNPFIRSRSTSSSVDPFSLPFEQTEFETLVRSLFSPNFQRGYCLVNQMCLMLCFKVIRHYGLFVGTPPVETIETMTGKIGLAPGSSYLLKRIIALLVEECYLCRIGGSWVALRPFEAAEAKMLHHRAKIEYPGEPMFELIKNCERNLFDFLEGRRRGQDVFFPMGDLSLWRQLHNHSLFKLPYAQLGAFGVVRCLDPRMVILEIGAGTGAGAAQVLANADLDEIAAYIYTDVSEVFLRQGRQRFGNHPFMTFQVYDLNISPLAQGFSAHSVDIIFGVNVLHVAHHLPTTLEYMHMLLKPNGWLIISEGSPPSTKQIWRPDLLFGFLEGWWNVEIDASSRPQPGFLMPSGWQTLLEDAGLVNVFALPGEAYFKDTCYGGLVIGQAPASTR